MNSRVTPTAMNAHSDAWWATPSSTGSVAFSESSSSGARASSAAKKICPT